MYYIDYAADVTHYVLPVTSYSFISVIAMSGKRGSTVTVIIEIRAATLLVYQLSVYQVVTIGWASLANLQLLQLECDKIIGLTHCHDLFSATQNSTCSVYGSIEMTYNYIPLYSGHAGS